MDQDCRKEFLMRLLPRLRFVDLEACDGGKDAWPIEIGIAAFRGYRDLETTSWSSRIRPDPSWPEDRWSTYAERVHCISRPELDGAPTARDVSIRVRELLGIQGLVLVSDSPGNDQPWLDRLMDLSGGPLENRISSVPGALGSLIPQGGTKLLREALRSLEPPTHRAAEDASRLARGLLCAFVAPEPEQEPAGPHP
ncbi:hypothetical protein [Paracoccus sp. ME4]|uniref:hypothetical protein n=1 Tax=Paracoccus sp. ME4 TaxID=3138066 RepID=UPI00398B4EB3